MEQREVVMITGASAGVGARSRVGSASGAPPSGCCPAAMPDSTVLTATSDTREAAARPGAIVQVGSTLAYRGIPLQAAYCGAKHAVEGFCDSLRTELLHDGSRVRLTMVQLPALNTPQFDWVKSRLRHRGQPVPPIFQPEGAADAIVWAADHDRREIYVGWPTVVGIVGNKILPAAGDAYLARNAYQSQQTEGPEAADRPDNLWHPVDAERDYGAHGGFDDRARDWLAALVDEAAASARGHGRQSRHFGRCRGCDARPHDVIVSRWASADRAGSAPNRTGAAGHSSWTKSAGGHRLRMRGSKAPPRNVNGRPSSRRNSGKKNRASEAIEDRGKGDHTMTVRNWRANVASLVMLVGPALFTSAPGPTAADAG
jgi:hypothetical protein